MKVGLRVLVEAKPDKVEDVKNFLIVSSYLYAPKQLFNMQLSSLRCRSSTRRH